MLKWLPCAGFFLLLNTSNAAAQPARSGRLLLTEVYYDTPGEDGMEEWIEIANFGQDGAQLSEYKVGDEESPGGQEGMVRFPEGVELLPGQAAIVAQTAAGFRRLFGQDPDYEIRETDPAIPNMIPYRDWATGDVALANDGDELLLLDGQDIVVDGLNYGDRTTFFRPSVSDVHTGVSIARIPSDCDTDTAADWQPAQTPSPRLLSYEGDCSSPLTPTETSAFRPIGEIQGSGDVSPYVNQTVSFKGVVTGTFEDRNERGIVFHTLFIQDLPGSDDGDPATSDGIALFLGIRPVTARVGDLVRVTGTVTEYYNLTEIDDNGLQIVVEAPATTLPLPVALTPPDANPSFTTYFEAVESMLVSLPGRARVVGPTHEGCEFHVLHPEETMTRVFQRDAEMTDIGTFPVLHRTDVTCDGFPAVKSGDSVEGIAGPLIFSFGRFRIVQQETAWLAVISAPMPPQPLPVSLPDHHISVATFNLQDYFDSVPDELLQDQPLLTPAEIAAKQLKVAQAIAFGLGCPTLLGVQEVENAALLLELADVLSGPCGFTYQVSHQESPDARGLDLALLSEPGSVAISDVTLLQGCTPLQTGIRDETFVCPAGHSPLFSRPPLQVSLEIASEPYVILVNHFKSKREGEAETAPRRLAQAEHVRALLSHWLAEDRQARIIVLGDFNDYEQSPVIHTLTEGDLALRDVLRRVPDEERYSTIYAGASQLIDNILVAPSLTGRVVSATIVHLNADYPAAFGQRTDPATLPYRSSDHDIPMIILAPPEEPMMPLPDLVTPTVAATATRAPSQPTRTVAPVTATIAAEKTAEPQEAGYSDLILCSALLISLLALLLRWRRRI